MTCFFRKRPIAEWELQRSLAAKGVFAGNLGPRRWTWSIARIVENVALDAGIS
jgi:hypothetical protein